MNALIEMTDDPGAMPLADLDEVFARLVRAHLDMVYGVALRMTGNAHDAEEIAQDAFENAYRALRRFSTERIRELRPRPWLAKIALNASRTRLRRKAHPTRHLDDTIDVAVNPEVPNEPWQRMLDGLPDKYRAAVILRYVEDLSYEETAEALGQPVGTVKTNVHRAMEMLRAKLDEKGPGR